MNSVARDFPSSRDDDPPPNFFPVSNIYPRAQENIFYVSKLT